MSDVNAYLFEIELALIDNPIIADYRVVRSWANADDGYIRIRATLTNGDFLEMAKYFALEEDHIVTLDYRHQWMDRTKKRRSFAVRPLGKTIGETLTTISQNFSWATVMIP